MKSSISKSVSYKKIKIFLSKPKNLALIGVTATLFSIFLSVLLTFWTIRSSEELAAKYNTPSLPSLSLYFGTNELLPKEVKGISYGYDFSSNVPFIAKIPIQVENTSKKTIENVVVTIRYNQATHLAIDKELGKVELAGTVFAGNSSIKREVTEISPFKYISYYVPYIHPSQIINIYEPIFLNETNFIGEVHEKELGISYKVTYAYRVDLALSGKDVPVQDYSLDIRGIQSKKMNELISRHAAIQIERVTNFVNSLNIKDRLFAFLYNPAKTDILVQPGLIENMNGTKINVDNGNHEYTIAVYSVLDAYKNRKIITFTPSK